MSSEWSGKLNITVFGHSHDEKIGAVIEGLPSGEQIDIAALNRFMERRRPGKEGTSQRSENDVPEIISGITDGLTDGSPLTIIIKNNDVRKNDYSGLKDIPRPGHADYPAYIKSNSKEDLSGGGKYSGRMTAPICAIGGIAKQILEKRGIKISANHMNPKDAPEGDSIGGIISCNIKGLPIGLGNSLFDGIDGKIASLVFAIPGVKGVEFGAGFNVANMLGSENNDPYEIIDGKVKIMSNNAGGILGGMTTGEDITFNVAIKPTPSIAKKQKSVNLRTKENVEIEIAGRHDVCIARRASAIVESVAAIAILDEMKVARSSYNEIRNEIDILDRKIAKLLTKRMELTDEIGKEKKKNTRPIYDEKREEKVIENVRSVTANDKADDVERIYKTVLNQSRDRQIEIWNMD